MSDQSQPREFWINTITKEVHLGPLKGADGNVRVVEYSFLENAEAKIKALEEADENRIDLNLHVSLMEEIAKARDQLKSEIEAQAQQLASLRAENEKLKSQTPTFIKMDETTEAFQQTRAAIENMKMFQKDAILLRNDLAQAKNEIHRLQYEVTKTHGEAYHQGLNDRQDEIDSLKVELAKANTKEFAANLKIDELRAENEKLKRESIPIENHYHALKTSNAASVAVINELKVENLRLAELASAHNQARHNYKMDIDELKAKLEALTKQHENCISMDVHLPLVEAMAKERDALKSKLEAAEKEIEQWQNDDVKADEAFRALNDELKILQAEVERLKLSESVLVAMKQGARINELEELANRYRTALDVAVTELRRLNMDAPIELTIHTGQVLVGITEIIASAPEAGPTKDEVIGTIEVTKMSTADWKLKRSTDE